MDLKLLVENNKLNIELIRCLLETDEYDELLRIYADEIRRAHYGNRVFLRGLIEFTNYCKNDCYYCGIRCGNNNADRYRLSEAQILEACESGYEAGYRTFVLQGGEDMYYSDQEICHIVKSIREKYSDAAITLSIGERSIDSYKAYFDAGADRFLLRHESADEEHYRKLHPDSMSLQNRKRCLYDLKKIGYQVGSGFILGSPYQTIDNIISDLEFLYKLQPDMIGIGPFVAASDTPFEAFENGGVELTIKLVSIIRICFPYALIPATTALGTLDNEGREKALRAGANVVMPNITPKVYREKYKIYDNKLGSGAESVEGKLLLTNRIRNAGYEPVVDRGDVAVKLHI